MSFIDHRRAPGELRIQAIRLGPALALSLAFMVSICGCQKDTPTAGSTPPARSPEAVTATAASPVFDLAGQIANPLDAADVKAVVFIFISTDCPISNRYAPEIRRVEEGFTRSGFKFWLVYADPDASPDAIRKHVKDYNLPQQILRDPHHTLVRLAQARVTPEAAVFLAGSRLVYHGRIDNRYADLGKERQIATQHDLEDVLKAILQDRPVPYSTARAIGCYISDPK